jgi:hypothetical protein
MESWRKVWREGVLPGLTAAHLESLRKALASDDSRLLQGVTCTPPPLSCVQEWPVEAACLFGIVGVEEHGGWGEAKVGEVEEFFTRLCFDIDQRMGETAGCRWLINWFDDTPRAEMRRLLLPEVKRGLLYLRKNPRHLSVPASESA